MLECVISSENFQKKKMKRKNGNIFGRCIIANSIVSKCGDEIGVQMFLL